MARKRPTLDLSDIASVSQRQASRSGKKNRSGESKIPIVREAQRAVAARQDRLAKLEQQIAEHQRRESELESSGKLVCEIDPRRIRRSRLYSREQIAYRDLNFIKLKRSIEMNGQYFPIKVRPIEGDPEHDYEVVAGNRRLHACFELNRPVRALVQSLDDREANLENWRENNERKELSPIEMAWKFQAWLDAGLFRSQAEIAQAVDRSKGWVSDLLAMFKLPVAVLGALADPRGLTVNDARKLSALAEDPACRPRLVALAKELTCSDLPDETRIRRLCAVHAAPGRPSRTIASGEVHRDLIGNVYARLGKNKGAYAVRFKKGLDEAFVRYIWEQLPEMHQRWLKDKGD